MKSFRRIVALLPGLLCLLACWQTPSPAQTLEIDRILFGSCIKQAEPAPIFEAINSEDADLFVFLGDNIYGDTTDMEVLQQKYDALASKPGFQTLLDKTPVLATWDDHDYGVNDGGASYTKREASERIFLDFWGDAPGSGRRQRPGVYGAQVMGPSGRRVQVILLDTRYFRSPLKKGERRTGGPYYPDDDVSKTMLGDDQWAWLSEQLKKPAELRIIASSIQCVASAAGQETWSNLPSERARLFKLIRETDANGVILISGDRHWAELSVTDEGLAYPLFDLTSSSLNQLHKRGTPTENRYRAIPKTFHRENYGVISIDWDRDDPMIVLQIRDMNGRTEIRKELLLSDLGKSS